MDVVNSSDLKHYSSNFMTVDPEKWGPHFWYVFHNYAFHYRNNPSDVEKEVARNLIKGIPFLLPCDNCSKHAFFYIKQHFEVIENAILSKENLIKFFSDFHNSVNARLKKPNYIDNPLQYY